ncbi:MAG: peptidase MA family metallohydrolase [Acidobacteriota bacterium]
MREGSFEFEWNCVRSVLICAAALAGMAHFAVADVIHLKSGRTIECLDAWIKDDMVYYKIDGGVLGFPKSVVDRIEKKTPPPETKVAAPQAQSRGSSPTVASPLPEPPALLRAPMYKEANAALESGDYRKAAEILETLKENDDEARLALGYARVRLQEWKAALAALQPLESSRDDDATLHYAIGLCQYNLGNDEWAIRSFRKSVELNGPADAKERLERLERQAGALKGDVKRWSHFVLKSDAPQGEKVVNDIMELLVRAYDEDQRALGHAPPQDILVTLTSERNFFDITGAPEWAGGTNDGRIYLPIGGLVVVDDVVERIVRHELAHSFIHSLTKRNIPIWLNEGLAMHLSGESLDQRIPELAAQKAYSGLIPLSSLASSFQQLSGAVATVAYSESLLLVTTLLDAYGMTEMTRLLRMLGDGVPFDEALRARYHMTQEELQERAWALLARKSAPPS